jgi:NADH-quinone oxidoreductase subunit F
MAVYVSGIIFENIDFTDVDGWKLSAYEARGGYQALKKLLPII